MTYPIFLTIAQTSKLLGLGRTAIYERINSGELKVAKIGRSTRITMRSVIDFALISLKQGNAEGVISELFSDLE